MLADRVSAGDFPSAVYAVAESGQIIFADAVGAAVRDPNEIHATIDTIYDLASLTKPLITGLLCARRIESGELTLDSSVAHYLPEFDRTDKQMITIRELLTHTSGLPAWRPLYVLANGIRDAAVAAIANELLEYAPGQRVVYSDLGFITLGFLLERMSGLALVALAHKEIIEPLKLANTFFNPSIGIRNRIAASEKGNAYERRTIETGGTQETQSILQRQNVIWGEVHDGNAYFLGGSAGHAGLFSTARETVRIAQQFLANETSLLKVETCKLFRMNMTPGREEARSIAWKLAASEESSAGPDLPKDSFGHAGFTGTSCWLDPNNDRIFVLLTNRTHDRTLPFANINETRRRFHSLAAAALQQQRN